MTRQMFVISHEELVVGVTVQIRTQAGIINDGGGEKAVDCTLIADNRHMSSFTHIKNTICVHVYHSLS